MGSTCARSMASVLAAAYAPLAIRGAMRTNKNGMARAYTKAGTSTTAILTTIMAKARARAEGKTIPMLREPRSLAQYSHCDSGTTLGLATGGGV